MYFHVTLQHTRKMSLRRSLPQYSVSERSYLLSDISRSNRPLPLPCLVEDGYYGARAWDTVSSGEVIFLNTLVKRPRALATDGQKHYSIPLDYPLKFSVIPKGNEHSAPPPKTIEQIVNGYKLPVTLKVDQKNTTLHLVSNLRAVLHLGNVNLTHTYDEKYFTGHSIIRNKLQNEVIMLPTFLKVRVRIIEGITGLSTAQWADVLETWKTGVKQPSLHALKPPIDIVVFSSIPLEAESRAATTTQKASEDIYETLEPTTYVKLNLNLAKRRSSNVYTSLTSVTRPTTTINERPGDAATRVQPTAAAAKTPDEKASARKSNLGFQTELQETLSSRSRPVPPPKLNKSSRSVDQSRRQVPTPPITKADESSSWQSSTPTCETPPPEKTQDRPFAGESLPAQPDPYSADVEIDPDYQISPRMHSNIHSLKEIPASVAELNVEEIADCLRLLKMAKYIDSFLANQVDGALLSELDEDMLTSGLQMSPLHAKKLILFAQKGWRPLVAASDL